MIDHSHNLFAPVGTKSVIDRRAREHKQHTQAVDKAYCGNLERMEYDSLINTKRKKDEAGSAARHMRNGIHPILFS